MPTKSKPIEDKKKVKKTTTTKSSADKVKKKAEAVTPEPFVPKSLEPAAKPEESKPSIMNSRPYLASTTSALSARAAAANADSSRMNGTGAGVLAAARAAVNSSRSTSQMAPTPILSRPEPEKLAEPTPVAVTAAPTPPKIESTGVDPVRFSVKRGIEPAHSDSNIRKILIYVVVVIAAGVGLIFAIERFIQSQSGQPNQQQNPDTNQNTGFQFITIGNTVLADSTAGVITPNADYDTADISLGSSRNDSADAKISKINHQIFQTFSRTTFEMDNVDAGLPEIGVSMADSKRMVTIDFGEVQTETEMLQKISVANSNIKSITGSKTGELVKFELELTSTGQFVARIDDNDNLIIEVKTDAQLATPDPEPTEPEPTDPEPTDPEPTDPEPTDPEPTNPEPPTGTNYTNPKSQDKQYVVSEVTGNNLISETYFYRDDVSSFLFSWGIKNTGENYIPNASAEYVTVDGKNYIEVKISNLKYDQLHSTGKQKATITVSLDGTPLKNVFTREFKNGTATFRAQVSRKVDFKLHSTLTYNGYQLLTLQVFDK